MSENQATVQDLVAKTSLNLIAEITLNLMAHYGDRIANDEVSAEEIAEFIRSGKKADPEAVARVKEAISASSLVD